MSKQEDQSLTAEDKVLDFEDAKELTVGQAVRKHEEIQAGVTAEDGLLDRYIKQHRKEIEAKKFDTQQLAKEEALALQAAIEEAQDQDASNQETEELGIHPVSKPIEEPTQPVGEQVDVDWYEEEEPPVSLKKQVFIWIGLAVVFIGILVAAFLWTNGPTTSKKTTTSSTSTVSSTSSSSSKKTTSKEQVAAFDKLYASFFVDSQQTKLKNDQFGKLPELKVLVDQLAADKKAHATAKAKYDKLEKAIQALQALNAQFDKPVIVDGVVDTTATAQSDAQLEAVTTGFEALDKLIATAVKQGRAQQTAVSSASSAAPAPSSSQSAPAEAATTPASSGDLYGVATPAGVSLERHLSRVPYDQAKIDDSSNPAWEFEAGVLETVISISQQRGYITGNDYILEKVNIINGNGYYNLFKSDGTYLFSINCKTGYFVGNASGNADDLDY